MIAAVAALWLSGITPQLQALGYGQPSAVLWKDQLFVATSDNHLAGPFINPATLYRGTFATTAKPLGQPVAYGQGDGSARLSFCAQAKLEIQDTRILWFAAGHGPLVLPMGELPYLERSDFGKELCRARKDHR